MSSTPVDREETSAIDSMAIEKPAKTAVRKHRSPNRNLLLDAARDVIVEEGYAAATSRRVAERAGLKPQLIYYYFGTFETLLLEMLRRGAERYRALLLAEIDPVRPLQSLWALVRNPQSNRFLTEFMALGNHSDAIRRELVVHAESFRALQIEALTTHLSARAKDRLPPAIMSVLIATVSRGLALEAWLGMESGLDETDTLIVQLLRELDETV